MANNFAVHSIGNSIATFLRNAYQTSDLNAIFPECTIRSISSGELAGQEEITSTLSLFLYRISINEHLRNVRRELTSGRFEVPLSLDLHFLLTAWFTRTDAEQTIMSWAMQQIYEHPTLSIASLSPDGGWRDGDVVQLIPAELSNEDIMRIWDALQPAYRLSFSYTARVVRIDGAERNAESEPVVANSFRLSDLEGAT